MVTNESSKLLSEKLIRYIKREMINQNISQVELYEKSGVSNSQISKILKGRYQPELRTVSRLLIALGLDLEIVKKASVENSRDQLAKSILDLQGLLEPGFRVALDISESNASMVIHSDSLSTPYAIHLDLNDGFQIFSILEDIFAVKNGGAEC